jgi:hypothetical protein
MRISPPEADGHVKSEEQWIEGKRLKQTVAAGSENRRPKDQDKRGKHLHQHELHNPKDLIDP